MNFGDIFGGIGDFLGSVFGGGNNDQKKKQTYNQPSQPVFAPRAPTPFDQPQQSASPLQPKPFTPLTQQPQQAPVLGGVKPSTPPLSIGGMNYTLNPDGSYTNSAGEKRTSDQVHRLQQINNNADTQQNHINSNGVNPFNTIKDIGAGVVAAPKSLVDFGNDYIVKPTIDTAATFVNQARTGALAQLNGAGTTNDSMRQKSLDMYKQDLADGTLSQDQFNQLQSQIAAQGARSDAGVKSAEQATGTKLDSSAGVRAGIETGANLFGADKLLTIPADFAKRQVAKLVARDGADAAAVEGANVVKVADEAASSQPARINDPVQAPEPTPTQAIRDPNSPITQKVPTVTAKDPAITSANPNFVKPTIQQPRPINMPAEVGNTPPSITGGIEPVRAPAPALDPTAPPPVSPVVQALKAELDKQAVQPAPEVPPVATAPAEPASVTQERALAEQAAPPNPEMMAQAEAQRAATEAPTEAIAQNPPKNLDELNSRYDAINKEIDSGTASSERMDQLSKEFDNLSNLEDSLKQPATPTGKLGSITRQSIVDGSINTPEGVTKAIADTRVAANKAAADAGDTLPNIIKKGQKAWEDSKRVGRDLNQTEVQDGFNSKDITTKGDSSFTPAQQSVYKDYAQETTTLRDRSGHSLTGGQQGAWYGPRQALQEDGTSSVFNPKLINEIKRKSAQDGGLADGAKLDTSEIPHEHAMQRYANAPDAGAQRLFDAVETDAKTGEASGVTMPIEAKQELIANLQRVTEKRDAALRLQDSGDIAGAKKATSGIEGDINKAFNDFADRIPGSGADKNAALQNLKDLREPYMQSTVQTLGLSNVVNRVADQGALAVINGTQPLARAGEKASSSYLAGKLPAGAEKLSLNTSKAARDAIKEYSKGVKSSAISSNFKANMSLAGAGRNPLLKGLAKVDAAPRAVGTAVLELGDPTKTIARKAMQLGVSRAEASGLTTKAEFKDYLAKYTNSTQYQDDLATAGADYKPRVGLAGGKSGDVQGTGISRQLSRLDNAPKLIAEAKGFNPKGRLINEGNDLFKTNVTGYAGVGSRVLGKASEGFTLKGVRDGIKLAKTGNPGDLAHAQQLFGQSISDAVATYGSAALAATALSAGPLKGVVGYTGNPAASGSSDAAYNKGKSVPPNSWYVNIGGNRLYISGLSRAFGAPGIAADLAGSISKSSNPLEAASSVLSQVYNQAGGSSLPDKVYNAEQLISPYAKDSDKKYALQQLESNFTPATGLLGNIANATDPTKRAPTNFVDDLKARLPWLRGQTPVAKDSQGNPIANSKQVSGGSALFSVGKNTDSAQVKAADPVNAEIDRLQKISGNVFPVSQNTNATKGNTQDMARVLMSDPLYRAADDKGKAAYLKNVLAGTSSKDINSSLSDGDKAALLSAKLQGAQKTKSWLDDNKNASSYYTADYNNAKANNTLDTKNEDMNNKSGLHYKAIEAQVNDAYGADYGLKTAYDKTSAAEFKAMLNPKSDTYNLDLATKLAKYDAARTKEHVSGNSTATDQLKYNLDKAYGKGAYAKTGRGGRGANGGNFATAALPSSLTGVNVSGSGSAYAKNAPLYTPIPDLKASATAVIPKGRTISITKGVKV